MTAQHTIYRYDIPLDVEWQAAMPEGARVLPHVTVSDRVESGYTVWAEVDASGPVTPVTLVVVGTGHAEVHPDWNYVGTYSTAGGVFVWHVYTDAEVRGRG